MSNAFETIVNIAGGGSLGTFATFADAHAAAIRSSFSCQVYQHGELVALWAPMSGLRLLTSTSCVSCGNRTTPDEVERCSMC